MTVPRTEAGDGRAGLDPRARDELRAMTPQERRKGSCTAIEVETKCNP